MAEESTDPFTSYPAGAFIRQVTSHTAHQFLYEVSMREKKSLCDEEVRNDRLTSGVVELRSVGTQV